MTVIAIIPLVVAVLGALVYALASDPLKELGRGAYWTGLLVTLLVTAHQVVRL